jgi:hypothetical protein
MIHFIHMYFGIIVSFRMILGLAFSDSQSDYPPRNSFMKIIVDEHFTRESVCNARLK